MNIKPKISVVDLFCGIGGFSYGLYQSGLKVDAGVDVDNSCQYAFEANCKGKFLCEDIAKLTGKEINALYTKNDVKVLVGCAPCQPFSSYTFKGDKQKDLRWQLLYEFSRIINEAKPDIVSMENVPQLLNFKKAPVFIDFVNNLQNQGYLVWDKIIYAPDYGIPQKRKILVLLASKFGKISLISSTYTQKNI